MANTSVLKDKTMLVIDDLPDMVKLTSAILEDYGVKVFSTTSGEEALEINKEMGFCLDLVISDVVMPKVNGLQIVKELLAKNPKQKILLVSGHVRHEGLEGLLNSVDCVDYLAKPYTDDKFIEKVSSLFE